MILSLLPVGDEGTRFPKYFLRIKTIYVITNAFDIVAKMRKVASKVVKEQLMASDVCPHKGMCLAVMATIITDA